MDSILAIENHVFNAFGNIYDETKWTYKEFAHSLPKKEIYSIGGIIDNQLVGFSIGYEFKPKFSHVSRFAISPHFIGTGISKKIMLFQLEIMSQNNCEKCSIDLTRKNERAFKFYSSLGFKQLKGDDLEEYVLLKNRDESQYLDEDSSHIAMVLIL
ncbi:GNAT family N-acetyltransferase [Mongoliibacter ruber]|uniref:Ribosomal protein S18 acetylase RimI-like enzyme n=1 Tax=Mongoliibacter ruber TaxID=1750599 RepID=A0A2T0WG46_9BACT|nr:GNAT family N-acetyltransferase [Mongoliibacter ruber]PRY85671.1 ribosomal protein S18 acetylase RimI-like enzyme [Mongoliibacter ruber]